MTKKERDKEEFFKRIKWILPAKPGKSVNLHPLFFSRISPISLILQCSITGRSFAACTEGEDPFGIIDAINDENEIFLKIDLNQDRSRIEKVFKKILTLSFAELKKHGRKRVRISNREFDLYGEAYLLREKGWTFRQIAQKMFPRDFNETAKDGANVDSAIKKATRFYNKAKGIINGEIS